MLKLAHKNLDVWKMSIQLLKLVYECTKRLPHNEKYNLIQHMRKSSLSVTSNIAEGFSRLSPKEKIRFIEISRSSLVELDTQFVVCIELEYFKIEELKAIDEILNHIFAMLTNLIKRLN